MLRFTRHTRASFRDRPPRYRRRSSLAISLRPRPTPHQKQTHKYTQAPDTPQTAYHGSSDTPSALYPLGQRLFLPLEGTARRPISVLCCLVSRLPSCLDTTLPFLVRPTCCNIHDLSANPVLSSPPVPSLPGSISTLSIQYTLRRLTHLLQWSNDHSPLPVPSHNLSRNNPPLNNKNQDPVQKPRPRPRLSPPQPPPLQVQPNED